MESTLHDPKLRPLSLTEIRPEGWLARQLRIQADGLSGHLDTFWPDVKDSQWFGGSAEAWERVPYWLDGVIPLAFLLDDPVLKARIARHMDHILTHQDQDGWLGPRTMVAAAGRPASLHYDIWAQLLIGKVLVQYYDASGDERAIAAIARNLALLDRHIDRAPLFNWGQFRWFEALIAVFWLYERTKQPWLIDLAVKLHAQGFNWGAFFSRWPLTEPTPKGRWNYMGHVVNNAMAAKAHGLWWRLSGDDGDIAAVHDMLGKLDRYHGTVTGMFTGDECLAGRRPTQGTELCAVVEFAYSLEMLAAVLGDPALGDRLEKVIFNALPATFSPDMWSHQYDQQVNQVECNIREENRWTTNGPESNIFGVEPNYGCCTANLSQGWPKFAAHLWMRTADGGLAAVAYAPSSVRTMVHDTPITVQLETDYPFRDTLHLRVTAQRPVRFPLQLRVPAWTNRATAQIQGDEPVELAPGSFAEIAREWQGSTDIMLTLPMPAKLWHGANDAVAVERGPLVYSLKIGEDWRRVHQDLPYRELPHGDWEVYPSTAWNYALYVGEGTLEQDITFSEHPVGDRPFSPQGAPVSAIARGKRLPEWVMEHGSAADAPPSPVTSDRGVEELVMIPYGCTNLRVTEFPVLARPAEGDR